MIVFRAVDVGKYICSIHGSYKNTVGDVGDIFNLPRTTQKGRILGNKGRKTAFGLLRKEGETPLG